MKKQLAVFATMALAGGLSAMASQVMLGNGVGGNVDPLRGGGIFNATFQNPVLPATKTYCLERSERLAFGYWYDYSINNAAVGGGGDDDASTPGYDIVSKGTAYIFKTYGQAANSEVTANAVQWAIWYLEDEFEYGGTLTAAFLDGLTGNLYSQYLAAGMANGGKANIDANSGVQVLNLYVTSLGADGLPNSLGLNRQDVLIGVPDGGTTLLLLGAGLTVVGIARRRLA
ncbi:MAG: VPDSG-CTERM sorting domain-containing protein [Verrucomicrobiales bacterium]|nr:VPDSG-CTERM sorting domain-containing protein [Verrucomicrobiales bacterium]